MDLCTATAKQIISPLCVPGPHAPGVVFLSDVKDGGVQNMTVSNSTYNFVNSQSVPTASPFVADEFCKCGTLNADGACTTGQVSSQFLPVTKEQRAFLRQGWDEKGIFNSPIDNYLMLRSGPM